MRCPRVRGEEGALEGFQEVVFMFNDVFCRNQLRIPKNITYMRDVLLNEWKLHEVTTKGSGTFHQHRIAPLFHDQLIPAT